MSAADVLDQHLSKPGRYWDLRSTSGRPLTTNAIMGMHRQKWATRTREIRGEWWALALEARIPHLFRARFIVLPTHANARSPQDVAACAPYAKAVIDGLVDAKVIPDDSPVHVVGVLFLPPLITGDDGLHLRIEEA